jgi:hypothetical protein
MTIEEASKIPANTEEFEAAVDLLSDLAEAGDKDAAKVLKYLLMRNDDFCITAKAR